MTDPTKVVATPPADRVAVKRALLSVYDKTGLVELAQGLHVARRRAVVVGGDGRRARPTPASRSRRWATSPARRRCSAGG